MERRGVGALCLTIVIFGVIVVHNILARNWSNWFGSRQQALLSSTASVEVDVLPISDADPDVLLPDRIQARMVEIDTEHVPT